MRVHRPLASLAPLLGLVLASACAGGGAPPPIEGTFDGQRVWADLNTIVGFGSRPSGSEALGRQLDWMEAELTAAGLTPVRESFTSEIPAGEITFTNLYADVKGDGEDLPLILIGSHIDTIRSVEDFVGANDSGSSTAVVLELARLLAQNPGDRSADYRFVFFDGEEPQDPDHGREDPWTETDHTYGSRHHVETLKAAGDVERSVLILLDMVGEKGLKLYSERYSNPVLLSRIFESARANGLREHVGGPPKEIKDDHLPFLAAGIPAVDLIDLSYGGPTNPHWHTSEDTIDKCAPESLVAAGKIVIFSLPSVELFARDEMDR